MLIVKLFFKFLDKKEEKYFIEKFDRIVKLSKTGKY